MTRKKEMFRRLSQRAWSKLWNEMTAEANRLMRQLRGASPTDLYADAWIDARHRRLLAVGECLNILRAGFHTLQMHEAALFVKQTSAQKGTSQ